MATNKEEEKVDRSEIVNALSGVVGSSCTKFFVHPIDTIKAKIQVKKIDFSSQKGGASQSLIL